MYLCILKGSCGLLDTDFVLYGYIYYLFIDYIYILRGVSVDVVLYKLTVCTNNFQG